MLQVKEVKKRNVLPNEGSIPLWAHFPLVRQAGKKPLQNGRSSSTVRAGVCLAPVTTNDEWDVFYLQLSSKHVSGGSGAALKPLPWGQSQPVLCAFSACLGSVRQPCQTTNPMLPLHGVTAQTTLSHQLKGMGLCQDTRLGTSAANTRARSTVSPSSALFHRKQYFMRWLTAQVGAALQQVRKETRDAVGWISPALSQESLHPQPLYVRIWAGVQLLSWSPPWIALCPWSGTALHYPDLAVLSACDEGSAISLLLETRDAKSAAQPGRSLDLQLGLDTCLSWTPSRTTCLKLWARHPALGWHGGPWQCTAPSLALSFQSALASPAISEADETEVHNHRKPPEP